MTNSNMGGMIREAKAYHKKHPKDPYWKYHFELSKGVSTAPPIDYYQYRKKHPEYRKKYPEKRKWTWKWLLKQPSSNRTKRNIKKINKGNKK